MDFSSTALWGAFFAIVAANLLLSGDNAVVIAMAARSLPVPQQKKAIFWGSAAAIGLRIVLTVVAVEMLKWPYLKLIGGVLLLWIGIQMLADADESNEVQAHGTLSAAVRTILVADLVMSVDNVIAVASAADRAPAASRLILLVGGLVLSIPFIIVGSTLLMKVMERIPIIVTLGAALLGYLAGQMFVTDPLTESWFEAQAPQADLVVGAACAVLVVVVGRWLKYRNDSKSTT